MTNQEDHLGGSLIASTIIHVGALAFMYFGLPYLSSPPPILPWTPVPVDIVEIGEITNTRIKGDNDDSQTARTAPPQKQAASQPEEKEPEPPKPEVKPAPAPEKPAPEEDDAALPTPQAKPKPPAPPAPPEEKKEEKPKVDPLASVLKNVAKLKDTGPTIPDARIDEKSNAGESKTGTAKGAGPALSDRLTISQEDSLRRQISGCWNMPVGARNAEQLIVEVLIEMNEDRTVRSAAVVDQARMASDPYFRAAAESALRALRNPKCSPLELPPDQYEQWKTIRFNFDPRDML